MRITRLRLGNAPARTSALYGQILGLMILLLLFGLIMVLSASSIDSYNSSSDFFRVFIRQGAAAILGVPVMILLARVSTETVRKWAGRILAVGLAAQGLVVFTSLGASSGGNTNWISLGSISVQPSEFLKGALVLWLAKVLSDDPERLIDLRYFAGRALPPVALSAGLVMLGHDLGTAMMMVIIAVGCFFAGRVPLRFIGLLAAAAALVAAVFVAGSGNRLSRISSWLDSSGCSDYMGSCWQTTHGTWALASGGLFGVGLGNSKSKWAWLPAAENDFIFAIIGEELGLVGAMVLIVLFVLLAIALVRLFNQVRDDPFAQIVVAGALVWIVGQAMVNIAVVLGLLPVLGVPLPMISNGGSSLLATTAIMGVVLGIARRERTPS